MTRDYDDRAYQNWWRWVGRSVDRVPGEVTCWLVASAFVYALLAF
jgi:hypothetical protein